MQEGSCEPGPHTDFLQSHTLSGAGTRRSKAPSPNFLLNLCGPTRPTPAETFLCEESFTKSTQGTSWFLDLQRRGSYLTPFEPPYIVSKCARQKHSAVRSGTPVFDILLLAEQTGGENFALRSSRGDMPLRGVSKEETSSLETPLRGKTAPLLLALSCFSVCGPENGLCPFSELFCRKVTSLGNFAKRSSLPLSAPAAEGCQILAYHFGQ